MHGEFWSLAIWEREQISTECTGSREAEGKLEWECRRKLATQDRKWLHVHEDKPCAGGKGKRKDSTFFRGHWPKSNYYVWRVWKLSLRNVDRNLLLHLQLHSYASNLVWEPFLWVHACVQVNYWKLSSLVEMVESLTSWRECKSSPAVSLLYRQIALQSSKGPQSMHPSMLFRFYSLPEDKWQQWENRSGLIACGPKRQCPAPNNTLFLPALWGSGCQLYAVEHGTHTKPCASSRWHKALHYCMGHLPHPTSLPGIHNPAAGTGLQSAIQDKTLPFTRLGSPVPCMVLWVPALSAEEDF